MSNVKVYCQLIVFNMYLIDKQTIQQLVKVCQKQDDV
jgi:hypothetical protein